MKENLKKMGIPLDSSVCVFCKEKEETSNHIFQECKEAMGLWSLVFAWWNFPVQEPMELIELLAHLKPMHRMLWRNDFFLWCGLRHLIRFGKRGIKVSRSVA